MKSSRAPLLPFAAVTLLLLLNYPWLSLFSSDQLVAGIPPLFLYLFALWLCFILTVRQIIRPTREEGPPPDGAEPRPTARPSTAPAGQEKDRA